MKLPIAILALVLGGAGPPEAPLDPALVGWAFPGGQRQPPAGGWDARTGVALTGSTARYSEAQLHNLQHSVDWYPKSHPAMPEIVANGRAPAVKACGFCHQPAGGGRPENASLAGLGEAYIEAQIAAFADGTRRGAADGWRPTAAMTEVAHAVTPAEVRVAAAYYHRLHYRSHIRVVETATVPPLHAESFVLVAGAGPREPIGARIVETPVDFERFEHRDPKSRYIAWVPPGSIARGRAVTERVGCPACHAAMMDRWGPGRSPSYIVRQLLAFRGGARHDAGAAPMQAVAAQLSIDDMIAVAAYWASLAP